VRRRLTIQEDQTGPRLQLQRTEDNVR